MPQNTRGIFHHSDVGCDIGLIVLDQRDRFAFPRIGKQTSEIVESGEAPVTFLGGETVGCN